MSMNWPLTLSSSPMLGPSLADPAPGSQGRRYREVGHPTTKRSATSRRTQAGCPALRSDAPGAASFSGGEAGGSRAADEKHLAAVARLDRERLLERVSVAVVHGLPIRQHRLLRVRRQLLGQLER